MMNECDWRVIDVIDRDESAQVTIYRRRYEALGSDGCTITEAYSIDEIIPDTALKVVYFNSGWGREYTLASIQLHGVTRIENTKGRSSAELHPQILVYGQSGALYSFAIAWSGNWLFELEPVEQGFRIRGGLREQDFEKRIAPGGSFVTPEVIAARSEIGSLGEIGKRMNRWSRSLIPRNELSERMPVEWNHWWAYEDKEINETIFLQNVDVASSLGIEVCTLDAGWFGTDSEEEHWFDVRGDWHKVNQTRFPRGIRYLSDYVHSKGMKFGLWCEIEGLGTKADLVRSHPQLAARRDEEFLGYVCLGGNEAQDWAFKTLAGMIEQYDCDWIKVDFNLDPGSGCNRTDHGHGPGDGLFEHVQGLYRVLDRVREAYPEVVLENCSSGGQRTDLGIMRHMHLHFLSDPDYSRHQLQAFWAATLTFPPESCLHWVWSTTCGTDETRPFPSLDLRDPSLTHEEIVFHMRVAMLHTMGLSHRLPLYDESILSVIREQITFYKEMVRDQVRGADLYRLTDQTLRDGSGAGWNAYQLLNREDGSSLVFVFRLEGSEEEAAFRLYGLEESCRYQVANVDTGYSREWTGAELMQDGLPVAELEPVRSYVMIINSAG